MKTFEVYVCFHSLHEVFVCFASAGMVLVGTTIEGYHTFLSALYFRWAEFIGMEDFEPYEPWFEVSRLYMNRREQNMSVYHII